MTLLTNSRARTAWALLGFLLAALAFGCSASEQGATLFHCPMHPTYVADHPGDCPICGMRLVPVNAKAPAPAAVPTSVPAPAAMTYTCPMHPDVVSDKPGRCPTCGMDLVPRHPALAPNASGHEEQAAHVAVPDGLAEVRVSDEGLKLAGVQTAIATAGGIRYSIRTVGSITADETRIRQVRTKISGWIEKLFVSFTGEQVRKGQPILSIYSQELLASQEEYLRAREALKAFPASGSAEIRRGTEDIVQAARRRLELFDVPPSLLKALDTTGRAQRSVTLLAPVSGTLTAKGTYEGAQVDPGTELFTVTDLSQVWIEADVYEAEARFVKPGLKAAFTLPYDPSVERHGRVAFVQPTVDPQSRTVKVRFDLDNRDASLKPGMFVNVDLLLDSKEGVLVPASSVMDTGTRQIVYVETGTGVFTPRRVAVGVRHEGNAQILSGLAAGERVVVKGNFLLDSESRLRAVLPGAETPR